MRGSESKEEVDGGVTNSFSFCLKHSLPRDGKGRRGRGKVGKRG